MGWYIGISDKKMAMGKNVCGTVVEVVDADTFDVRVNAQVQRFRLVGVDAPELSQPFGLQAYKFAYDALNNKVVTANVIKIGLYGRKLCVLYSDGHNFNEQLISNGFAWVLPRFVPVGFRNKWQQLQAIAQANRKGLWSQDNPVSPSYYRSLRKKFRHIINLNL